MSNVVYSRPSPDNSFTDKTQRRSKGSVDGYSPKLSNLNHPKPQPKRHGRGTQQTLTTTTITTEPSTSTGLDDTIHYLSPASPISVRTVHEGDYIYESPSFVRLLEEFGRVQEYTSLASSTISCIEPELQRTMAFVRPEAMDYKDVILRVVHEAGFCIIRSRTVHLTPEQVSEIYAQYYGCPSYPHMVVSMSVGPILALSMAAINAVSKWKEIVGPEKMLKEEWFYPRSMRLRFGIPGSMTNAVHASENLPDANRENRYFNPDSILEPIMTNEMHVYDYCSLYVNPTLLEGLTEIVKTKPIDPIISLAEWLLLNNPFQPRLPREVAMAKT